MNNASHDLFLYVPPYLLLCIRSL